MTAAALTGARFRAIVVDDDPDLRLTVRYLLEADGSIEVVGEAGDGAEAIRLAHAVQPDLVLLDLDMPGMHGLEALPALRRHAPGAVIVVLSGRDARDAVCALGAHGFLRKPCDLDRLADEIAVVLGALPRGHLRGPGRPGPRAGRGDG